jgi:hypothetical protein
MRYWRILLIEDESYDLQKEIIDVLCVSVDEHYKYNFDKPFIENWSENRNKETTFPLIFESLTEAWFGLKKMHAEMDKVDIAFVDIKLEKKASHDSKADILSIKEELIQRLWALNCFRHKNDIENMLNKKLFKVNANNTFFIQERGGIYLASLIKLLFPSIPTYVYTESMDAFSDSIPFLMAGMYTILYSGKFLKIDGGGPDPQFEWHNLLKKQMKQKIVSGAVSLKKIFMAMNPFKKFIEERKDDMAKDSCETEVKIKMYKFLNTDIGSCDEPGWTIGSFFVLFVKDFHIKSFKRTKEGIDQIEKFFDSIDFARLFGAFFRHSHFNAYTHAGSNVFKSGIAEGLTPIEARKKELLKTVSEDMQVQWEKLACSFSPEVKSFFNDYIKKAVEKGNDLHNRFFTGCEEYKTSARLNLRGIFEQIKIATEDSSWFNELNVNYFVFSKNQKCDMEIKIFDNYNDIEKLMGLYGTPEAYLPLTSPSRSKMNLLGYLVKSILHSFYEYGFEKNPNKDSKVGVIINHDEISREWIIKIIQVNGNSFPKKYLKEERKKFFPEEGHSLRDSLRRVRNWIRIMIKSSGVSLDPHSLNWHEEDIAGKVEYELIISLAGDQYA